MAINLVTGQPRNGKTLWTLWYVRAEAERDKRTVYYNLGEYESGPRQGQQKFVTIPGWVHLEKPEDWPSVPDGSIVVIDEAQRAFRPRHVTSKVPEHVSKLETHGHKGLDLFFITQHPGLIEGNVLRLVQSHRHVKRLWGAPAATVHQWEDVNRSPDQSRRGSLQTTWRYPKDVYKVYESATHHTVKVRPPLRLFLLVLMLIAGPGLIAYALLRDRGATPTEASTPDKAGPGAAAPGQAARPPGATPLSVSEYAALHRPRVEGLQYTAPVYDQVMQVQSAPVPVGCLASIAKCRCYTEQGTPLGVPKDLCEKIAESGYFQFWRPSGSTQGGSQGRGRPDPSPLQASPRPIGAGAS